MIKIRLNSSYEEFCLTYNPKMTIYDYLKKLIADGSIPNSNYSACIDYPSIQMKDGMEIELIQREGKCWFF